MVRFQVGLSPDRTIRTVDPDFDDTETELGDWGQHMLTDRVVREALPVFGQEG